MRRSRRPQAPVRAQALAFSIFRWVLAASVVGLLVAAVTGGLLRAQSPWPHLQDSALAGQAAVGHAFLMLSAFLGTAIAMERAVAIGKRWAFTAPIASVASGLLLMLGQPAMAAWLGAAAALVFCAASGLVVKRQPLAHSWLLLLGAWAWLVGNLLFACTADARSALGWWFTFVVLTIAAERLEMSRLMRHHLLAKPLLGSMVVAMLAGAAYSQLDAAMGGAVFGAALMALAAWLAVFDIARRTVRANGLSRYMAVCLLSGYAWLAVGGLAWWGTAWGCPGRDMALHTLGLGFIISMVMGHAPVILPAVARVKLLFGPWFYAPLVLLHASLLMRLFGGIASPDLRALGALLNVVALAAFALTVAGSALAWRMRPRPTEPLSPSAA